MYNHFVCQLTDTRLMDTMKQYKKRLNSIDKQHNFIVLRSLYDRDYVTEMKRSMLPENLQHIHENLCVPSKPYRRMQPINFTNKKIQSCQDFSIVVIIKQNYIFPNR